MHIGYGDSATDCILEAIKEYQLPGDGAIPSRDDFTQGPISDWLQTNGIHQRIAYWESMDKVIGLGMDVKAFSLASLKILDTLESEEITLWIGDSCHDILATGWLLSYFLERDFDWYRIDLAQVDADDLQDGATVVNLAMYHPQKLKKLYAKREPLSTLEKDTLISRWQKACTENAPYRIQKDNQIISVEEDYYDNYILSFLSTELETCSSVVSRILNDGTQRISDSTIQWNIKKMIDQGRIVFEGDWSNMNTYSIKIEK